jgi:hypothetical protein
LGWARALVVGMGANSHGVNYATTTYRMLIEDMYVNQSGSGEGGRVTSGEVVDLLWERHKGRFDIPAEEHVRLLISTFDGQRRKGRGNSHHEGSGIGEGGAVVQQQQQQQQQQHHHHHHHQQLQQDGGVVMTEGAETHMAQAAQGQQLDDSQEQQQQQQQQQHMAEGGHAADQSNNVDDVQQQQQQQLAEHPQHVGDQLQLQHQQQHLGLKGRRGRPRMALKYALFLGSMVDADLGIMPGTALKAFKNQFASEVDNADFPSDQRIKSKVSSLKFLRKMKGLHY